MLGLLEETLKQHAEDYHGLTFNNLKEYIGKTKGYKNISKLTQQYFGPISNLDVTNMQERLKQLLQHTNAKG